MVAAGEDFVFVPREIAGSMDIKLYSSNGTVVFHAVSTAAVNVSTSGFAPGVYFYMLVDEAGYKKTGKLLVK
jgi:hypothetical protein